ncbi:MAG: cyclodeaminase/cyclohydrolase family protein [Myxococcales bacterium]|nr:cyclodeaminase/cyclohydrolase family protein [Myxococcales bacterium]
MSTLIEMPIRQFLSLLASEAPAPGGGSVAALAGAQAAALMAMVCRLTIGKKKYLEVEADAKNAVAELDRLAAELLALVDADTAAYNAFGAAMALPKETDEQKAARRAAMQAAAKEATQVPARTLEAALATARIIAGLYPRTNRNCLSDAGTGMQMAAAAVSGAAFNVLINLPGTGDEEFSRRQAARVAEVQRETAALAARTLDEIGRLLTAAG